MKLGVSTSCFYPLETELSLEEIGKAGIKNTEIFFNAESELKPAFIDILNSIQNEYNINVISVHPTMSLAESFMIFSEYERRYYQALDDFARYSEIAAELGAEYIILHGGKPNGILNDEEYCERYMALNQQTQKNGVTVLQENVTNFRAGDIEFLRSMRNILKNDAQFCLDIKQTIRSGYDPFDLIEEFFDNIKHYHISDHSLAGDCLLPLNGKFNFPLFFKTLDKNNYNGACVIEVYKNAYREFNEVFNSYNKLKEKI